MGIRILSDTDQPSQGFVRRPHPVWLEFAKQMTWFSRIEIRPNGTPEMVYVWVSRKENTEYERGVPRRRYCKTYRGQNRSVFVSV
jgi:hypothetical protein